MRWTAVVLVLVAGACGGDATTGGAADGGADGSAWPGGPGGALPDAGDLDARADDAAPGVKPDGAADGAGQGGAQDGADAVEDAVGGDVAGDAGTAPGDAGADVADASGAPDAHEADADGGGADAADAEDAGDVVPPDAAPDVAPPDPVYDVEVASTTAFEPWEEVRHVVVDHPGLVAETHTDRTRYVDGDVVDAFGTDQPGVGHMLLHVSAGCDDPARVAVLVPGAGSEAQTSWADPPPTFTGLADRLVDAGVCVYALTFSHSFGDNLNQAICLAAAIEQARLDTGAEAVAVVGHSKGGIVATAYATGLAAEVGAPFAGDVDRLVLLGAPLGGMDWAFRHPAFNLPADLWALPMPGSWDQILEWGFWTDATEDSIYGPAFRGIAQLTTRWDETYALSMVEQDWYTTYEGGWGFVSHSLGIDAAIELGGDFMQRLHEHQVPGTVAVSVVAGANPWVYGALFENTGPSDGLVFLDSATEGALFALPPEVEILNPLCHWDLVAAETAQAWVVTRVAP